MHGELERKGMKMAVTNPRMEVADKLVLSGFLELVGESWMFLSNSYAAGTRSRDPSTAASSGVDPDAGGSSYD
ncbi:hypothetical protein E2562_027220 [Oryza meyeriana var. granulata]|uniref:Uncharacterized protein n=1 Tax=Oryza meyeriana var. granulata TaxID=110450 RepID=A0A6G1CCY9_9ORYZ|nr:hypothetical protein E2562_008086 [Oryza meyeriana var. granulata]KAF0930053.1 hypothetical protein E2562_027220 [Oryza meyeriana var. granulata]